SININPAPDPSELEAPSVECCTLKKARDLFLAGEVGDRFNLRRVGFYAMLSNEMSQERAFFNIEWAFLWV
ncbi:hypothetical protein Tco_1443977, partial [Tanacetum coccineum]